MTRKIKRKIHIGQEIYYWVAEKHKLDLYPGILMYIRVHNSKNSKSMLYINANAWHFELNPHSIKEAIEFSLENNWDPNISQDMYVSKNEAGYYILPKNHEQKIEFMFV